MHQLFNHVLYVLVYNKEVSTTSIVGKIKGWWFWGVFLWFYY